MGKFLARLNLLVCVAQIFTITLCKTRTQTMGTKSTIYHLNQTLTLT